MAEKYLLDLNNQQKKLLNYCFTKCKKEPPYFEDGGELYLGSCPDLQIEKIVSVLSEVYFEVLDENDHLAELINNTIIAITKIGDDIIENYDFCAYFSFNE